MFFFVSDFVNSNFIFFCDIFIFHHMISLHIFQQLIPSVSLDHATPSPPLSPTSAFVNKQIIGGNGVKDAWQVPEHRHTFSGSRSSNNSELNTINLMQPNDSDALIPRIWENEEIQEAVQGKSSPFSPRYREQRGDSNSSGSVGSKRWNRHSQSNSEHFDPAAVQLKRPRSNPSPNHARTGSLQYVSPRLSRSPDIKSNGSSTDHNPFDHIKGSSPISKISSNGPDVIQSVKSMPEKQSNTPTKPKLPRSGQSAATVEDALSGRKATKDSNDSTREKRSSGISRFVQKSAQFIRSRTSKSDMHHHDEVTPSGFSPPPRPPMEGNAVGSKTHHGMPALLDEDEESDLSTDDEMVSPNESKQNKNAVLQCSVISARKYADYVEYEIEVTHHNETWVLYKQFKVSFLCEDAMLHLVVTC